ncbi:MAG: anthranilate phosphoribosyltransferase [Phycisphaerales bacterium]
MIAPLTILMSGERLSAAQAESLLRDMASGALSAADSALALTTLRDRGETAAEIAGFAQGMRTLALNPGLDPSLTSRAVDIVGTGGDNAGTFNISTGAALLVAACGTPVVKHGNRAVSSRAGSADVLQALGLPMPMTPAAAALCLLETNFTFLFAPAYHPALARIAPVRKAIGTRTIFNILGPLTNPAQPPFALIGAYSLPVARLMAQALATLPIRRAAVVHSDDGLDEATCASPFTLISVAPPLPLGGAGGGCVESRIDPAELGFARCTLADLKGGDAVHNAAALRAALSPGPAGAGPLRDTLILNASLALASSSPSAPSGGGARVFEGGGGSSRATAAITSGRAADLLDRLAAFGASLPKERP